MARISRNSSDAYREINRQRLFQQRADADDQKSRLVDELNTNAGAKVASTSMSPQDLAKVARGQQQGPSYLKERQEQEFASRQAVIDDKMDAFRTSLQSQPKPTNTIKTGTTQTPHGSITVSRGPSSPATQSGGLVVENGEARPIASAVQANQQQFSDAASRGDRNRDIANALDENLGTRDYSGNPVYSQQLNQVRQSFGGSPRPVVATIANSDDPYQKSPALRTAQPAPVRAAKSKPSVPASVQPSTASTAPVSQPVKPVAQPAPVQQNQSVAQAEINPDAVKLPPEEEKTRADFKSDWDYRAYLQKQKLRKRQTASVINSGVDPNVVVGESIAGMGREFKRQIIDPVMPFLKPSTYVNAAKNDVDAFTGAFQRAKKFVSDPEATYALGDKIGRSFSRVTGIPYVPGPRPGKSSSGGSRPIASR